MSPKNLKLGTRRSLLALAQSGWVAREIERLNPGVVVDLVGIDTRGDKILDVPLSQVEGKEFFVAELDDELRTGRVDFTVHSLKDLSLERPPEFKLAAIPAREDPRDVIIFSPHARARLQAGERITVGTSSPRRLQNLPRFLEQALPRKSASIKPTLSFEQIRGNINTRLSRLREPVGSKRYLDAVVLALAGLNRLCANSKAESELRALTQGVRFMVLPLTDNPTAPGQGALAVECRASDHEVSAILRKLHDVKTEREITRERAVLLEQGGGCHQSFGATSIELEGLGTTPETSHAIFIKGTALNGKCLDMIRWTHPSVILGPFLSIETQNDFESLPVSPEQKADLSLAGALFVSHWRAVDDVRAAVLSASDKRVWVPGTASWFKLAAQGIWVEGCSESLGFESILKTLNAPALALPALKDWMVFTHLAGTESWRGLGVSAIHATYKVTVSNQSAQVQGLAQANVIFWGSGAQFTALYESTHPKATHCCGPGKTAQVLKDAGVTPLVFPNRDEWLCWSKAEETV